jgi:uncharacterized membrane protein
MHDGLRLWEIDFTRGIAILMMIVYHTVFDIEFFQIFPIAATTGFWHYFAYATASLFLMVVGVSLVVSHARAFLTLAGFALAKKFVLRGAGIFALGLLVTFATWLYLREGFVVFGILHLIGVSVALSPLFFRLGKFNILAGILIILAGLFIAGSSGPFYLLALGIEPAGAWSAGYLPVIPWSSAGPVIAALLLPLGIHSGAFWSVDYTPLFPWFGMVLIGLGLGSILYAGGVRQFSLRPLPDCFVTPLTFLGRHSLIIYLVHQPVIILFLALVTGTQVL